MTIKKVINDGTPVKIWTNDVEDSALTQLSNMSKLPFIHNHIAVMPDVHLGNGATIGSVIPTNGAVIPAAVGVDIGCGCAAQKTTLTASDLPDNLARLRSIIEHKVPHGRTDNGGKNDRGGWGSVPNHVAAAYEPLLKSFEAIIQKHPKVKPFNLVNHLGTLGGGNHFIEICIDEKDAVWIMLHSGSRGPGNKIGSYFITKAKEEMEKYHITNYLPDKNLAYLVEHTEIFDDYCNAVLWAQQFASINRDIMMSTVSRVLYDVIKPFTSAEPVINCHHNYISHERHYGKNVIVTRKGAISAAEDELGIIPGSMGDKSFIVRGKGNRESLHSCSHGAGRKMSRTEAKRRFTKEDLIKQTEGIECPKDEARIDEIPAAYKSIDDVMKNQEDLVEVLHTLRQVVNVKG